MPQSPNDPAPNGRPVPETGRRISLRASLWLLVLICIAPGLGVGSYLTLTNYQLEKRRVGGETKLLAGRVMADLERELAAIESGSRVLATAESLRDGDLAGFYRVARNALRSQIVRNYILTDREGRQVVNTLRPWGSKLPAQGTPADLAAVFTSGTVVLSNLFEGPVIREPVIAMGVPVTDRESRVVYSLNVGLQPAQLNALLARHDIPDGWLVAVLDRAGTIVARSRVPERFIGQKAVPDLVARLQAAEAGTLETLTKEGVPVVTTLEISSRWGWGVVVGAPKATLEAGMVRSLSWLGGISLLIVLLGSWLATVIARRVVTSVHHLNDAALALREGKPISLPEVQLDEAEEVGQAIVQASHLMAKVHHRAYHDPLTELGNRALFYELVQHHLAIAGRDQQPISILAIDLDNFKVVNDEEGHAAGDQLLEAVARRIESTIRASDAAARMGGDEFSILLVDADQASAQETAQRLVLELAKPYEGIDTPVSASIGIAVYPTAGKDLGELLENADRALYAAKRSGRNTCCLADSPP